MTVAAHLLTPFPETGSTFYRGAYTGSVRNLPSPVSTVQSAIEQELLTFDVICTDATLVKTDGKQTHIRNFSTETCVLYCSSEKKDLETLGT